MVKLQREEAQSLIASLLLLEDRSLTDRRKGSDDPEVVIRIYSDTTLELIASAKNNT